jgi:hypothetical protein
MRAPSFRRAREVQEAMLRQLRNDVIGAVKRFEAAGWK